TESGMYISFDDGTSWKPFQLNLPVVPVTDLAIKNDDLIVATQGRSFWVLDDLTPLHQLNDDIAKRDFWLFQPRPTYRLRGSVAEHPVNAGKNAPNGVLFRYTFKTQPDSNAVVLKILEQSGQLIKSYKPKAKEKRDRLPIKPGMNRFVWNMRYPDAEKFPKMILWGGGTAGPKAVPGTYEARLVVGKDSVTTSFEIRKDPRVSATLADLQAQFDFLISVRDKLSETHVAIKQIREIRKQVNEIIAKAKGKHGGTEIEKNGKALVDHITKIERALYQTKNQSRQDPLNFPIKLNNRLSALASVVSAGDFRPTAQAIAVRDELTAQIDAELAKLHDIVATELPAFNRLVHDSGVPAVVI
ncbi:MAG: glycosyl hydrolase, partial [Calditrichaeota bacterium]